MLVTKTNQKKCSYISYKREYTFRDIVIVFGKRNGNCVFLSTFNNLYLKYEIISVPVANGTYKIKVASVDNYLNENTGTEGSVTVAYYSLPPKDLVGSVSGSNVTLTWAHSADGVPDNYIVYGNGGSGNLIDRTTALSTVAGSVLTTTFAVANGQWKFVVEAIKSGLESKNLNYIVLAVPITAAIPPSPGPSPIDSTLDIKTGLILENISIGKVKIRFYWPHGSLASTFRIYYDNATGTIDYVTPLASFARLSSFTQEYTTVQLHATDTVKEYKFVVRAVSADGVEDDNTDEYSISVDGASPDNVPSLTLDTVF